MERDATDLLQLSKWSAQLEETRQVYCGMRAMAHARHHAIEGLDELRETIRDLETKVREAQRRIVNHGH